MNHIRHAVATAALLFGLGLAQAGPAAVTDPTVTRTAPDKVVVSWTGKGPVDLYSAATPDADIAAATLVAKGDRKGQAEVTADTASRRYFLIRDPRDGSVTRVAERLVPLQQGSNFRDIGGYPAADGRHVRWGMIFRSGATPMLTPADQAEIGTLGLRTMVDLRSEEERGLAPTKIENVTYTSYNYSFRQMLGAIRSAGGAGGVSTSLYATFPAGLAPQMRILFQSLLHKDVPLVYNCSAGQDRTGFATAMILSALGVPRDVILKDYQLSTQYRQPLYEMPPIDPARQAADPIAKMFGQLGQHKPQPLIDANGQPLLLGAFAAIDAQYGSVDAYLDKAVGIGPVQIAALRAIYTE